MLRKLLTFDLAQLSDQAGVSQRTVRYYIQQGLLPSPDSRGPGAHYGIEHLERLTLIRKLQREHLPLGEIRNRLDALSPEEIRDLLAREPERPKGNAAEYIRGVLSEGSAMLFSDPMTGKPPTPSDRTRRGPPEAGGWRGPGRAQWDRITIAPDVEVHIRRPLTREQNKQVERLLEAARDIFEERS